MAPTTIARWSCLLLLLSCVPLWLAAQAQYHTTYVHGVTDVTSYATSTTNAWKIVGNTLTCTDVSFSPSGTLWCINTGTAYHFNIQNQNWLESSMINLHAITALDDNDVWVLQGTCTGGYKVWKFDGTSLSSRAGCLTQIQVGNDGTLVGINYAGHFVKSTNGGTTWTSPVGTAGWTFASVADANTMCAINSGQLYAMTQGGGLVLFPTQPTGTLKACAVAQDDPVLLTLDTANNVKLYDGANNVWKSVVGTVTKLVATSKSSAYGLNGNHVYHWNVYAGYVGGTTGGVVSTCPVGPCNPGTTHTGALQVKFPHGLNGTMQYQTIPFTATMNLNAWDASVLCDPFTNPTDPECSPTANGGENCNQSGAVLGEPQPPDVNLSEDWATWNGQQSISATLPLGPNLYDTYYECGFTEACEPGTIATCKIDRVSGHVQSNSAFLSQSGAQARCRVTQPWGVISLYDTDNPTSCSRLIRINNAFPIPGVCY